MNDVGKSILGGIAATPLILIATIGLASACGLNPHFILVSVLITNVFGLFFNRNSSDFFNIGTSIVVMMFMYQNSIGIESGYLQTFIIFAIPAIIFLIFSFLPINYMFIPNRVIAILSFGIGVLIIIKQLPNAFFYTPPDTNLFLSEEDSSQIKISHINNWIQLALALLIPTVALIGRRFKKSNIALLLATIVSFSLAYIIGYANTPLQTEILLFKEPFKLNWTFSVDIIFSSIELGCILTFVMLISFVADFSILNHDDPENRGSIKKSLRTVGIGNLVSGIFGVMPANISLFDSLSIKAFGGQGWISKIPILLTFLVIAIIGIPNFNIPLFVFAGLLIYIGIHLIIKSWQLLKEQAWVDYIFTFLIGLIIILYDLNTGIIIAILYTLIYYFITTESEKNEESELLE